MIKETSGRSCTNFKLLITVNIIHWPDLCSGHTTLGEILKRSFISTVRPSVHINPSRKRSFSKTLGKPEDFENGGLSFFCVCGPKSFRKQSFSKTMASGYSCDFLDHVFLKHKSKMTTDSYRMSLHAVIFFLSAGQTVFFPLQNLISFVIFEV